jgi:activator of 2-hydroxyglutaryl-CoA dehydratase
VKVEDLVRAVFGSVVKRIMEMTPLKGEIVLTGGVIAYNPILVEMLREHVSGKVLVPPEPQLTCALGAALTARKT